MTYTKSGIYLFGLMVLASFTSCYDTQQETAVYEMDGKIPRSKKIPKQDRIDLAMEQEFIMTVDPALGYVPRERLAHAKAYAAQLESNPLSRTANLTWQERGPNNVAGRTRAVMIDRRDATGNTVFASGVSGGIWRATNFKSSPSWTPLDENMESLAVCALAQDPSNPNIMYAGTGEGWFNSDAVRGNGIWKSTNGGTSWEKLTTTDSTASGNAHIFDYVNDLLVNDAGIVFATARPSRYCNTGGVRRSTDGGLTWTTVVGALVNPPSTSPCDSAYNFYGADLEIASNGDIYATTGYGSTNTINRGRIFRSTAANAGAPGTWTDITPPAGNWQRIEIATAASAPGTIYAVIEGDNNGIGGIRKTTDFGATWTSITPPSWCSQGVTNSDFTNGQAWYDLIVQVDPNDPNTVLIGGIDLFKSTNGGTTWTQISQWSSGCTGLPFVHADQHNIIYYPGSSLDIINTNDGGIYYSDNAGITWTQRNGGYNITQFYAVDIHPTRTDYFLGGSQDNGTQRFQNPGINSTTTASGGDGAFTHIDQDNGAIQVSSYVYNNIFYSRNDGVSFSSAFFNNFGFFINPTEYDDIGNLLYTSTSTGQIGVVTNLAGPGNPVFNPVSISALGLRQVTALKADPTRAGTAWVAGYSGSTRPVILKISGLEQVPNGIPTVEITSVQNQLPTGAYISSIDINPDNNSNILFTVSNFGVTSIFESQNNGSTWLNIEGNIPDVPVRWGMFVPSNIGISAASFGGILIGTEIGVWYTGITNNTATIWTPQNAGLPRVRVDMLKLRRTDGLLAAATHGRGLFTTTMVSVPLGVPTVANTSGFIDYISADRQQLFINVGTLNSSKMRVRIVDAAGRVVYDADRNYQDQKMDIGRFARGSYILTIVGSRNERYTKQFIR